MAFFLESTFVGLFFFGWDRLSKRAHLLVTFLVALGSNLSALWILVANAWMSYPVGAEFNIETMRMELTSFTELFFNPVAQVKFVHTVGAGYVTATMFVLAVSSWYILKGRDLPFARRSFAVATGFGLASILSVIVLGDESGVVTGHVSKVKLAAMEAEWETEPAPSSLTLVGLPDQEHMETKGAIRIPWVGGLLITRSIDTPIPGIKELMEENKQKIRRGMEAYALMEKIRGGDKNDALRAEFEKVREDLGYGMLLRRYTPNVADADEEMIQKATRDTIPNVALMFWAFRLMVGLGFWMLFLIGISFYFCARRIYHKQRWLLRLLLISLPAPWLACWLGWFVVEYGRQPWTIGGVLPTYFSVSALTRGDVIGSFAALMIIYTLLAVPWFYLMQKYARLGPSSLHTGRYHFEQTSPEAVS